MNTTERINGKSLSPPVPREAKDAPRLASGAAVTPAPVPPPTIIVHPVPPRLAPYSSKGLGQSLVVSHAPIHLTGIHVGNLASATRYLHLFDQGEIPKTGARPARFWTIPAESELDWDDANGRFCPAGLTLAISSTRTTTTLAAEGANIEATFHRAEV